MWPGTPCYRTVPPRACGHRWGDGRALTGQSAPPNMAAAGLSARAGPGTGRAVADALLAQLRAQARPALTGHAPPRRVRAAPHHRRDAAGGDSPHRLPYDTGISVSQSSATASASVTPAAQSARSIDFKSPAVAGPIIDHFKGGQITPARIAYVDLTGDRVDDAVVVVESGGTAGDLGAAVFSTAGGKPRLLGYVDHAGRVEVRLGGPVAAVIVVTQGVYALADAQCCPSKLRELILQWDGRQFAVVTDQVIDNPRR